MAGTRGRIKAQIGSEDPCAVEKISPDDLSWATGEHEQLIAQRKDSCKTKRDEEQKAEEERKRVETYQKGCTTLANAVDSGAKAPAVDGVSPEQTALLRRVAKQQLVTDDLGPKEPEFPCADTEAKSTFDKAFAKAVLASRGWLDGAELSPRSEKILAEAASSLPEEITKELDEKAERLAASALISRQPEVTAQAKRLCKLKELFGMPLRQFCRVL